LLHKAGDIDPAFTHARALLVGSYALDAFGEDDHELIEKVEATLEGLRKVAPDSADHLIAQTYYTYYILRDYDLALRIAEQALDMVPSDAYLLGIIGWIKRRQGDDEGHLESMVRARQLEPGASKWTEAIVGKLVRMHRYDEALAEIEAIEGRHHFLEFTGAKLAVREHGDLERFAMETQGLADEVGDDFQAYDLWLTRLLVRDYDGAAEAVDAIPTPPERDTPPRIGITNKQALAIMTYWLLGDADKLAELVAEARESISRLGTTEELLDEDAVLPVALLAAVEGETAEAERFVRAWYQGGAKDLAGRGLFWDIACQILGIAGAAEATVSCIRQGLELPSGVMPFIEPHLPFYDPIRNEPVFVELVEELAD
jgi:tetratricopeptide (TPR) repeat protein